MIEDTTGQQLTGVSIVPITTIVREELESEDSLMEQEAIDRELFKNSLSGHIQHEFQINKDARRTSGIEEKILSSIRSYNGEYDSGDMQRIAEEGGSTIFMNLTATKSKIAKSWITDIYRSVSDDIFSIEPSPNPDLPAEMVKAINDSVATSIKSAGQKPAEGQQGSPINEAQKNLSEINQEKRDITATIAEEINKEAKFQMGIMERQIKDQLVEGNWENALNEFVEDFTIYPTAFMKGPIVTKQKKLVWENGEPTTKEEYVFINERVDPLDMYPSPSAKTLQDGNNIEHVRFSRKTLSDLKKNPKYKRDALIRVLDNSSGYTAWLDTGVETSKADEEFRGNEYDMNRGIIHGLHYFGSVPAKKLREWGLLLLDYEDTDEVEVEAILAGNEVIKCDVNKDPLLRRPYYSASFYNRPGSLYGRSLPEMMRDIQRMCNATARALANNLGIASGPMMEVYIDRLADDGDIEDVKPMKIYQVTSDPSGGGGRAVNFFQPKSNAAELLGVYEKYEKYADDVTGIPKYAYGNEKTSGAATTLTGLSLILESATKVIKDAVRNIDIGLIKPRVEFQFYYNLVKFGKALKFSGDVNVVPRGSTTLTVKAAQQIRRNEFLQITANPMDQEIMGVEGRANLLREIGNDLGLDTNPIPGPLDLKRKQKEKEEQMAKAQEAEQKAAQQAQEVDLKKASLQIEGQKEMAKGAQAIRVQELQLNVDQQEKDRQVKIEEIGLKQQEGSTRVQADLAKTERIEKGKDDRQTQEVALSLSTDDKVN